LATRTEIEATALALFALYRRMLRGLLLASCVGSVLVALGCAEAAPPATPADPPADTSTESRAAPAVDAPSFENDPWALAGGDLDGHRVIVRVRVGLERFAGHRAYPTRVEVIADLIAPFEDGMPQPDDARALNPVEDEIVDQFEGRHTALLAAVVTGNGARTYILMSKQPNVDRELAAIKAQAAGRAIHLRVDADPKWTRFRELDAALRTSLTPM
jgi:Family of unknown function (DUF695)